MTTKAEQLEELKATAVKLQRQIWALEKPEKPEKPKQWEPRGGHYCVTGSGSIFSGSTSPVESKFGAVRRTLEAAVKASVALRTHNRLLAYVDEFGGDWEADWEEAHQVKHTVYYDYASSSWSVATKRMTRLSGAVYMSQDCAVGLRDKINSGEVVL